MQSINVLHHCKGIIAIGGGHGLGRILASLGFLGEKVSGIVATTDNGGSTGRLRRASGCIGWGDLRHCLSQLCFDNPTLARTLFEYRYTKSGELTGHVLGNLILLALDQMSVRPLDAINLIRQMLQIEARLYPMSEEPASLAGLINGEQVIGETEIDQLIKKPDKLLLLPNIAPTKEALEAIRQADLIILGPGSFMTSILPSLLIKEINTTIKNSRALKVFVGNLTQEKSAMKHLLINEKLDWLEELTGIYPDILLWPSERTQPETIRCNFYQKPLGSSSQPFVHDRKALRIALEELVIKHIHHSEAKQESLEV